MSNSDLTWSERANWGMLIGGAAMGLCSILFFVIGSIYLRRVSSN